MRHNEAVELIRGGVAPDGVAVGGVWADLGAGSGTFTRALAELLGSRGVVYAVERDSAGIESLRMLEAGHRLPDRAELRVRKGDFTRAMELPELDGVLMANALHFVAARDQETVLRRIVGWLRPGGALVLVEYDRTDGNRWVPWPVSVARFRELTASLFLKDVREVGRRRSAFGREMYAGVGQKAE